MGQFALGIRSLLIKATIFVIMAALLAWALGGTLWPRPETVRFDSVSFAGQRWYWQLAVGGKVSGEVRWELMRETEDDKAVTFDNRHWSEVAGPIVADDALYFAGRASMNAAEPWRIEMVVKDSPVQSKTRSHPMPDRLAVEQQLARLAAGLPLQDAQTILQQRAAVLDPKANPADQH